MTIFSRIAPLAAVIASVWVAASALAGPVNVNTADAATLARELNGVGMAKAEAIVAYRNQNGPFRDIAELAAVKGIGVKLLERNSANLRFAD